MALLVSTTDKVAIARPVKIAAVVLILAGLWGLRNLLLPHPLFCAGLLLLPALARVNRQEQSIRYLWPILLLIPFAGFTTSLTLAYFTWVLTLFLLTERFIGRLNYLPLLGALVVSPIFSYLIGVFSFSLRLKLTAAAGALLAFIVPVTVEGNIIYMGNHTASIDPACMGLNLSGTALLLGIIFMARFEKLRQKAFSLPYAMVILFMIFGLNIIANLVRIMALVCFKILPDTAMHDVTGLAALLVYVAVPGYFLVQWLSRTDAFWAWIGAKASPHKNGFALMPLVLACGTTLLLLYIGLPRQDTASLPAQFKGTHGDYTLELLNHETIKLHNEASLIYLKKIKHFYGTEHNPMVCWAGSGYEIKQVKETTMDHLPVYEGTLVNKSDTLYTAWWYSNGTHETISQWEWRLKAMQEPGRFYLVNVTAETPEQLRHEVAKVRALQLLENLD
jgi:exosortase N